MFELPSIDFSQLNCSHELEAVGLEDTDDLIKPVLSAMIKYGIQCHITDCNLSTKAADELVAVMHNEGIEIVLDQDIRPNPAALNSSTSDTENSLSHADSNNDDYEESAAEYQRVLNYISWSIEKSNFTRSNHSPETVPIYPLNLLNAVYGENKDYHFHSPELIAVMRKQFDSILNTLSPMEEKMLRAIFQEGMSEDDFIYSLGLEHVVAMDVIHEVLADKEKLALRKLRHPSRSKTVKDFFTVISYLESVDGATLDDFVASCLHGKELSWITHTNENKTIDWDTSKNSPSFQQCFDRNALPVKLILRVDDFKWCQWQICLLLGSTLAAILPNQPEITISKAFFSTNTAIPHYLLAIGQSPDGAEGYALFEFSGGSLSRIQIDPLILKNLQRIIEKSLGRTLEPRSLHSLYTAEQQFCAQLLQQVSDPREKDICKMFLEVINAQLATLPQLSKDQIASLAIKELNFSVPTYNALKYAMIDTVGELASMTEEDLIKVQHLGRKGREEVINQLCTLGINLKLHP